MKRREFIALAGAAAVARPAAVIAQQSERVRRIGVLAFEAENNPEWHLRLVAFFEQLQNLGWTDGRNLRIDSRFAAGDVDQLPGYAAELVALSPDVIVAISPVEVKAVRQQTRTIPIVFVVAADPVSQGLVESLARPGGNITGFSSFELSMGGKWLEMFREIAPNIRRFGVVFNPVTAAYMASFLRSAEASAKSLGVEVASVPVHDVPEVERVIARLAGEPGNGLMFPPDVFTSARYELIASLVAQYGVPAVFSSPVFARLGGLLGYGPNQLDNFRRAASYVDRVLKGAKPAELPVQQPTKFELAINLKAAKALGLTVPASLLARADEVIE
jgi:putative tryptophan/tyrosine transport system substrate-binding protein